MLDDIDSIIEETRLKARKERLERERLHLEVAAAKREEEKRERKRRIQNAQEAAAAEADVGGANEQVNSKKPVPLRPMSYSGLKATKRKRTVDDSTTNAITIPSSSPKLQKSNDGDKKTGSAPGSDNISGPSHRYAPAKKPPRSKVKPVYESKEVVALRSTAQSSDWYEKINTKIKISRSEVVNLQHLLTLIDKCVLSSIENPDSGKHIHDLNEIRTRIHEIEFYQFLNDEVHAAVIKKSKVLEDKGLRRVFDSPDSVHFPWDVKADAEALYIRWIGGNIDSYMLRGLNRTSATIKGVVHKSYSLIKGWPHGQTASVIGHNNLFNGQWWPLRICALRDGAHGAQESGIYGKPGVGAIAVAVAEGGYEDRDYGSTIEYCGTMSQTEKPTNHTEFMLESYKNGNPIRVLRGKNPKSEYAPREGIRYDGLYQVTGQRVLEAKTAMYRFTLTRVEGQDPIRCQGVETRPTPRELAERAKLRDILG